MIRLYKIFYLLLFFVGFQSVIVSQDLSLIGLGDIAVYYSLKEASRHPNEVEGLVLKKQKLKELPLEKLLKFPNLVYLDVSKNKLDSIPKSIDKLNKLQVLDLSANNIVRPPETLYNLTELKFLKLGRNKIDYVSHNVSKLKELLLLDLWSNDFIRMPEEIKQLKNLRKLDVRLVSLSQTQQDEIKQWLPDVNIMFSNTCDCD